MQYIASKLNKHGIDTEDNMLIELKTNKGAIKRAKLYLGERIVLYSYTNLYDYKTYKLIYKTK